MGTSGRLYWMVGIYILLHVMLSLSGVSSQSYEEVGHGAVDTEWMKTPEVVTKDREVYKPLQNVIQKKFKTTALEADRPILRSASPAMQLITQDTGVKDFLEGKTIKASVSELSELSKVKIIKGEELKSCDVTMEGPKMYFTTCPGDLVVVTISGSMKMTCNEIEKRVFYGPVTIKSLTCQQSFEFQASCDKEKSLGVHSERCKEMSMGTFLIIQILTVVLAVMILAIVIIWYRGMMKGIKIGNKRVQLKRKGCYYIAEYREFISEDGKRCFLTRDDPSEVNMESKTFKRHWCWVLFMLITCHPLKVNSYSINANYDTSRMKYTYQLTLGDTETIDFGTGKLSREAVIHTGQITKMFGTSTWTLDTREVYFCQWYKCEAMSVCGMGILPFIKMGTIANNEFRFDDIKNSYFTCQKLYGYCAFGNGCKLIAFEIKSTKEDKYTVYSISSGGSHGGLISAPVGCVTEHVEDQSSGAITDYLLVHKSSTESYLCHHDLFSAKPEMGMLGDLQISDDGIYHFATNEVNCVVGSEDRALCRYSGPFMNKLKEVCEPLSSLQFKVIVDTQNKIISWRQSGQATVTLKCDRKLPFPKQEDMCEAMQISIWEIAHSDANLLLSFKAYSKSPKSTFLFPSHINMRTHLFKCDGETYFSEIYDLKSLNSSGFNFTLNTIPYASMDALQEDHFSDVDPDVSYGSPSWATALSWLPSITTCVIFFVIALLIMKMICNH